MNGPWFTPERVLPALGDALRAAPADQVEVFAQSRVGEYTRFAASRVHQPQSITEAQIMVRAVVGTGSARVAVSALADVATAVARACALARARDGSPGATRPYDVAAGPVTLGATPALCESTLAWDAVERSRLAGEAMASAARAGGTAHGTLSRAITELAVVTSRGVSLYGAATEAGFAATVRVGEVSSYVGDLGRDAAALDVRGRCLEAIEDVAAADEPVDLDDGVYDVVFGPLATGELIGFLPDFGYLAPAVRAGIGLVAERAGRRVASPLVTVSDDASDPIGLTFPFDFEGTPKAAVDLLRAGVVGGAVSDRAGAAATGGTSTGHASIGREQSPEPACANLVMAPGTASTADLVGGVERGIYVQRLWYNRLVDVERGLVVGTSRDRAFLIEDGRPGRSLRGARFNESVIDALERVDGVSLERASQPIPNLWNSSITAPAMRVRGFRFGARTRGGGR